MHTLVLSLALSHLEENDLFNSKPFTVDLLEQLPTRTGQQAQPPTEARSTSISCRHTQNRFKLISSSHTNTNTILLSLLLSNNNKTDIDDDI